MAIQTVHKTSDICREIAKNNDLLALPESVVQVLESVSKEDVSIDSLADIIIKDPALTGRLLKIANSPFFGLSHQVKSIQHAVLILGMTTVKCLAISAAIFSPAKIPSIGDLDLSALYGNFISIATTARKVAEACNYSAPESAFTCGLLLDIGLLYFINNHPRKYESVLYEARKSGRLIEQEVAVFGISHPEVGSLIASKWGLPDNIANAIARHHEENSKNPDQLEDIIRLAVVLNRDILLEDDLDLEDKINKLSASSKRLNLDSEQMTAIAANTIKDAFSFARAINVEIEDFETILSRANKELFSTYLSLQSLFRERQELNERILKEERSKGILEAKRIATSTLSHYINNAAMEISGHSQLIRIALSNKSGNELKDMLPHELDVVDSGVKKIVAVLQEIADLNMLDDLEFFEKSKILNIDDKIKERIEELNQANL